MKNPIKKILALCAAAVMSTACFCTAVSAEEYSAPTTYTNVTAEENIESVERVISAPGTYSNGSSYIVLRTNKTCYLHIVYTNGMYVRANGTYVVEGETFGATLNGYIVVDSDGTIKDTSKYPLGVDGLFSRDGTTLTISDIKYYKD